MAGVYLGPSRPFLLGIHRFLYAAGKYLLSSLFGSHKRDGLHLPAGIRNYSFRRIELDLCASNRDFSQWLLYNFYIRLLLFCHLSISL
jgi:hypothetical protein